MINNISLIEDDILLNFLEDFKNSELSPQEFINKKKKYLFETDDVSLIKNYVYSFMCIDEKKAENKTRKREIVKARQIAMFFAKLKSKKSLNYIGKSIGGKDHATVLHAIKVVNNLIETKDPEFYEIIKKLSFDFGVYELSDEMKKIQWEIIVKRKKRTYLKIINSNVVTKSIIQNITGDNYPEINKILDSLVKNGYIVTVNRNELELTSLGKYVLSDENLII